MRSKHLVLGNYETGARAGVSLGGEFEMDRVSFSVVTEEMRELANVQEGIMGDAYVSDRGGPFDESVAMAMEELESTFGATRSCISKAEQISEQLNASSTFDAGANRERSIRPETLTLISELWADLGVLFQQFSIVELFTDMRRDAGQLLGRFRGKFDRARTQFRGGRQILQQLVLFLKSTVLKITALIKSILTQFGPPNVLTGINLSLSPTGPEVGLALSYEIPVKISVMK